MEIEKIISKSKDGNKMEVTATNGNFLNTLHIQKYPKEWKYCAGYEKGRMILKSIKTKENNK